MNIESIKGHKKQITNLEFILNSGNIPQAILFTGITGIGKKMLARRFLNALFCKSKYSPCLSCSICKQIAHQTFPDYIEMHPNEKGIIPIGSEENRETGSIRWLIERLSTRSISGKVGVLIDGIDIISEEGQNALLKIIEEPSYGTCFILISSNRNNLLPTILSRCMEIRFYPLSNNDVKYILSKNDLSIKDLDFIAKISGGSIEIADILTNNDLKNEIIKICKSISSYFKDMKVLDIDLGEVQNKIKFELLLDIIINIFRQNLLTIIKKDKSIFPQLEEVFIDDEGIVLNLLKIMIILKKNESRNLNIRYALKGMLYSLYSGYDDLLPYMKLINTGIG